MAGQDVPLIHHDKQQRRRQLPQVHLLRQLQSRQKLQQCAGAGVDDRLLLHGLLQRQKVLQRMLLKAGAQPAAVFHRRLLRVSRGAGPVREHEDLVAVFRAPVEDHILTGQVFALVVNAAPQISHNVHKNRVSLSAGRVGLSPARPAAQP